jgi:hypothetical protein
VHSAAEAVVLISEPHPLMVVSNAVDRGMTVQSASATVDAVSAYYAPLEQALGFVDQLLGVASNFANVSAFHGKRNVC